MRINRIDVLNNPSIRPKLLFLIILTIVVMIGIYPVLIDSNSSDSLSFNIDEEDVSLLNDENSRRAAIGNYEAMAELFVSKILANDDLDNDGISTIINFVEYVKKYPSTESIPKFTLDFIRNNIEYESDEVLFSSFEWAQYPAETLKLKKGDCEDKVILLLATLYRLGYCCGLALFSNHVVAMVEFVSNESEVNDDCTRLSINNDGKQYYAFETTADFPIGYTYSECTDENMLVFKSIG